MSAARDIARVVAAPGPALAPASAAAPRRAHAPALARRLVSRLGNEWLPRVAWTMERTGRPGLVGIALLLGAALFLFTTHRQVAAEVESLRGDLAAAHRPGRPAPADEVAVPAAAHALPARTDVPALLRQLFGEATRAGLAVDTGKYEIKATRSGGVVRHQIAFPLTGPYPHIRDFLDATLATMPEVALGDLLLERKSISDGEVQAQIRMTVYTLASDGMGAPGAGSAPAAPPPRSSPRAPEARLVPGRVVTPTHAAALFAQHSWAVLAPLPKLPPPPPAPPPPEPTAPPLPYTLVGSVAAAGSAPVFYLAHGDRVIDARVGDRLDGVYQLESAAGSQLVFVYLPLNVRQILAAGASK